VLDTLHEESYVERDTMATRGDIRDAFTSEMKQVSGTYDVVDENGTVVRTVTLDTDDIGLRNPEQTEPLPQIVYHDDYRKVVYNGVGTGPDYVEYRNDGTVDYEVWREYIEAQFIIDVRSDTEGSKEPIYEALRARFGQYQFSPWDESALHDDVIRVQVLDSQSVDSGDVEDVIRGDQIEVRITFHRDYTFSTDNITDVNTAVDADDDGTVDYSYTTN
jgi:hypothetical protein